MSPCRVVSPLCCCLSVLPVPLSDSASDCQRDGGQRPQRAAVKCTRRRHGGKESKGKRGKRREGVCCVRWCVCVLLPASLCVCACCVCVCFVLLCLSCSCPPVRPPQQQQQQQQPAAEQRRGGTTRHTTHTERTTERTDTRTGKNRQRHDSNRLYRTDATGIKGWRRGARRATAGWSRQQQRLPDSRDPFSSPHLLPMGPAVSPRVVCVLRVCVLLYVCVVLSCPALRCPVVPLSFGGCCGCDCPGCAALRCAACRLLRRRFRQAPPTRSGKTTQQVPQHKAEQHTMRKKILICSARGQHRLLVFFQTRCGWTSKVRGRRSRDALGDRQSHRTMRGQIDASKLDANAVAVVRKGGENAKN
jgi:hypothetical protein